MLIVKHTWDMESELNVCTVCGLFEGGLTTDCSGEISVMKSDEIYTGKLDYRSGEGWVRKFSPMIQSSIYTKLYGMHIGREGCFKSEKELMLYSKATKEEVDEIKAKMYKDMYS